MLWEIVATKLWDFTALLRLYALYLEWEYLLKASSSSLVYVSVVLLSLRESRCFSMKTKECIQCLPTGQEVTALRLVGCASGNNTVLTFPLTSVRHKVLGVSSEQRDCEKEFVEI